MVDRLAGEEVLEAFDQARIAGWAHTLPLASVLIADGGQEPVAEQGLGVDQPPQIRPREPCVLFGLFEGEGVHHLAAGRTAPQRGADVHRVPRGQTRLGEQGLRNRQGIATAALRAEIKCSIVLETAARRLCRYSGSLTSIGSAIAYTRTSTASSISACRARRRAARSLRTVARG